MTPQELWADQVAEKQRRARSRFLLQGVAAVFGLLEMILGEVTAGAIFIAASLIIAAL